MKLLQFAFMLAVGLMPTLALQAANSAESPADAPYLKEQWPKVRTLVWAKLGESGTALGPGNWTEFASAEDYAAGKGGKPAANGPDAKSDIVLPDAPDGKSYIVGCMVRAKTRRRSPQSGALTLSCRHVTIGAGAALDGGIGVSRGKSVTSDWPDDDTPMDIYGLVQSRVTVGGM